jgi:hypothetical protein
MVVGLVTVALAIDTASSPEATPMQVVPPKVTVAPYSKPAPVMVTGVETAAVVTKGRAEGLTFETP